MVIEDCRIVKLPRITDPRGNLTFIDGGSHVPFNIGRVYYVYDVPGGVERGGHAHRNLQQLIIPISGNFDVVLDNGACKRKFHLNCASYGLYISQMIWIELDNFSSGSVCLCLASTPYDEADYFREYSEFVDAVRNGDRKTLSFSISGKKAV